MIDISPYKFKKLKYKADYVHVAPCPDVYRGNHRGEDEGKVSKRYCEDFKAIISHAGEKGRKVIIFAKFFVVKLSFV